MNPFTHLFTGWLIGAAGRLERRDRVLVALAGIAPDADALGAVPEILTRDSAHPLAWYSEYHHLLGHNVVAGAVLALAAFAAARRRLLTAALALASFHLHLLEDLAGSRGPDGYAWPIPYLAPFDREFQLTWSHQWPLASWQNLVVTLAAIAVCLAIAWSRGCSPVEVVSSRAERAFIEALRTRFPRR